MAIQDPTTPASEQAADYKQAKAASKAAKAYAKAQRPWYRKKRYIISLAVAVLAIIGVASSSNGTSLEFPRFAGQGWAFGF
jgi:hypothetical protein